MILKELKGRPIYLASKSPRRRELLTMLGITYESIDVDVEEHFPNHLTPAEAVTFLAQLKMEAIPVSHYSGAAIFITCDTIVICDEEILGKPIDEKEAVEMLEKLSGRTHQVMTAIALHAQQKTIVRHAVTEVTFKNLTAEEIAYYVTNYRPFDKAGAYGIQEWIGLMGVTAIEGSYFNVVGLPTDLLWEMLSLV